MKRVLVIDDEKTFDFPSDWDVTYARTLDEGTTHVIFGRWEEIWLDHDLGGDDTIRPLVLELAQRAYYGFIYPVDEFVICSLNVVGQKWIESTLNPYYRVSLCTSPKQLEERIGSRVATWY